MSDENKNIRFDMYAEQPTHGMLNYIEDGKLKDIVIPLNLVDKFKEEFKGKKSLLDLTIEEVTNFLKENK